MGQLQNIAEKHGWHKFVAMQNLYNLLYREEEREMIPYCQNTGVGLTPWYALASGTLARSWNGVVQSGLDMTRFVACYSAREKKLTKSLSTAWKKLPKRKAFPWHR